MGHCRFELLRLPILLAICATAPVEATDRAPGNKRPEATLVAQRGRRRSPPPADTALEIPATVPSTEASDPAAPQSSSPSQSAPAAGASSRRAATRPPSAVSKPLGYAGRSLGFPKTTERNDFLALPDRWRIGVPPDYLQHTRGSLVDPYGQNVLKGDYPIFGQDKFLVVSLTSDTLVEARRLPVPSGVSTADPGGFDFFGSGEQQVINQNFILSVELFEGDAAYKPRDWEVRATAVANLNFAHLDELALVNPNVQEGTSRYDEEFALQEWFYEKHLGDLSSNYDFWAVRAGMQGFTSDFRGFLFSDNEPGIRLFGNSQGNRVQWNLAYFAAVEKDTNSGLNTLDRREQDVFIANIYGQDFIFPGYTAQLSFHANIDRSNLEYDRNGFLVRPAPVGTIDDKEVYAYYLGWAGDGHIGRLNISHQFYQVFGRETFNPLAGRGLNIGAQFFATELSFDQDWLRYRAAFAYSSGDSDPEDATGGGFDTIFDNPNFAGGGFSFFTRQAVRLTGSGVNLVNRNSFVPNLRTSKEQGQANFVNPGLFLYNIGLDAELTPRLRVLTNASYLRFADTQSLELILQDQSVPREIGVDLSVGVQYRPRLNNNVQFTFGAAALVPGEGFKALYSSETLYSGFMGTTFTY